MHDSLQQQTQGVFRDDAHFTQTFDKLEILLALAVEVCRVAWNGSGRYMGASSGEAQLGTASSRKSENRWRFNKLCRRL